MTLRSQGQSGNLLKSYAAEASVSVGAGPGGEIENIFQSSHATIAEHNGPQSLNGNRASGGVRKLAQKGAGGGVESRNVAVAQITDQDIVAEGSEICGCESDAPGGIQFSFEGKALDEVSIEVEHIHYPES